MPKKRQVIIIKRVKYNDKVLSVMPPDDHDILEQAPTVLDNNETIKIIRTVGRLPAEAYDFN